MQALLLHFLILNCFFGSSRNNIQVFSVVFQWTFFIDCLLYLHKHYRMSLSGQTMVYACGATPFYSLDMSLYRRETSMGTKLLQTHHLHRCVIFHTAYVTNWTQPTLYFLRSEQAIKNLNGGDCYDWTSIERSKYSWIKNAIKIQCSQFHYLIQPILSPVGREYKKIW